jgi:phosphoserine aminotransferase
MVIVKEELIGKARPECPTMLDYATMAETGSMYNTPPCWAIYVCGLVFKKLLREGGLSAMAERNAAKVRPPACLRPARHCASASHSIVPTICAAA